MNLNLVDFDETLVFSTKHLYHAYNRAFKEILNKTFTWKEWQEWTGQSFWNLLPELGVTLSEFSRVHYFKNFIYPDEYLDKIKINTFIYNLIEPEWNINCICSQTSKDVINKVLFHNNISHTFTKIYDRNDVPKKKPAPDMYLKAIQENFNKDIKSINIYEDSYIGLRAAVAAFLETKNDEKYENVERNIFKVAKNYFDIVSWKNEGISVK